MVKTTLPRTAHMNHGNKVRVVPPHLIPSHPVYMRRQPTHDTPKAPRTKTEHYRSGIKMAATNLLPTPTRNAKHPSNSKYLPDCFGVLSLLHGFFELLRQLEQEVQPLQQPSHAHELIHLGPVAFVFEFGINSCIRMSFWC